MFVGTWSLDQTLLWTPGTNATTGEHVDLSDLALVGGQTALVQAVVSEARKAGKKVVVVFVSGKPVTVPGVDLIGEEGPDAVVQQFYQGELGGLAIAEVLFGAVNPSGRLWRSVLQMYVNVSRKTQVNCPSRSRAVPAQRLLSTTISRAHDRSTQGVSWMTARSSSDTRYFPGPPCEGLRAKNTNGIDQYVTDSPIPLWSFGHGLSYTTFT